MEPLFGDKAEVWYPHCYIQVSFLAALLHYLLDTVCNEILQIFHQSLRRAFASSLKAFQSILGGRQLSKATLAESWDRTKWGTFPDELLWMEQKITMRASFFLSNLYSEDFIFILLKSFVHILSNCFLGEVNWALAIFGALSAVAANL